MYQRWLITFVLVIGAAIADEYDMPTKRPRKKYGREEENILKKVQPIEEKSRNYVEVPSYVTSRTPENGQDNFTKDKDCSLSGTWINSHGSEVILNVTEEGNLIGKYLTAVEAIEGAAGEGYAQIIGNASAGGRHRTFGFTVVWNEGTSTTSWTGQCFVCDGQEILKTTWILASEVDTCNDDWLANRIGQEDFIRSGNKKTP